MKARWAALAMAGVLCACRPPHSTTASSKREPVPANIREVTAAELKAWQAAGRQLLLIDIRNDEEWQAGHAASALHISRWTLGDQIASVAPDKRSLIVLYCLSGKRSAASAEYLQKLGYRNVYTLAGGFKNYQAEALPVSQ